MEMSESERHNYYFFRRFKTQLNKGIYKKFSLDFKIKELWENLLPTLKIFALSIKFLITDMLKVGENKTAGGITKDDI